MLCDVASASSGVASAYIIAQIAGVNPVHHIAVLQGIAGTTVVREPSVDAVHPPGQASHIKLIEVIDPLYIGAVIYRSPVGFHVDGVVPTYPLENIEYALALAELYLRGRKDDTVLRHKGFLALNALIHIVQDRLAGDGYSAGILCVRIHIAVLRLYRCRFSFRHRVGHVLVLIAGILRLHRLRLTAGSAKKQHRC
mgnify:CR=1 FL=1